MRFGLISPSYTARSSSVADEETINWLTETRESSGAVAPSKEYGGASAGGNKSLFWTPGLTVFSALPQSPVRGSQWTGARLFAVAGAGLYEITSAGTYTLLGTIANDGNAASMAWNGPQILIVSGGRAYCLTLASNALVEVTAQLSAVPSKVVYGDTYFVVMFKNSNKFEISALLDGTTWPGIQVDAVSVFPENITSIIANHRELWVFGARHAQPYQDTGSAEVYDVIPGAFIEAGCAATFAPCLLDNSIFWISEDDRGGRMAWRANGYTPTRISTHAVEIDLASYPTLQGMTTYSYQDGGHLFWMLYIPGSPWSWCFDVSEGVWSKRASWANGKWGAHYSWNHVYAFGQHLVGDWNSGNLYSMSLNAFTDNGAPIRRLRRAPTVIDEMDWIRHSKLTLDFEMGNLSTVNPTDVPAYASALYGPKAGGAAVDTATGGVAWVNSSNVLANNGNYATAALTAVISNASSSTSTGTTSGGGVPWSNPGNIDSNSSFASVLLTAGGPTITPSYNSATVSNAASPSNQFPPTNNAILAGFPSTACTDATVYVVTNGSVVANQGGGVLELDYSTDSGATWNVIGTPYNATFPTITLAITLSGITNLDTVQLQLKASASCAPTGFSNTSIQVVDWYAIVAGSGQPTSQTLKAAVSGLTVPAGTTILGVGLSFNADYVGDAPTFQVGLNVGNLQTPETLTASPAIYTAGGSAALWGYDAWTAATLASLEVSFFAATTGNTTVNVNTLIVTVYYTQTAILSDALDITQFGFTVPVTATPKGITAALLAFANVTGATITVQPLKAGAPVGNSQTLPLPTDPSIVTFGGDIDLFGEAFTYSDFDAATFGLRVTVSTTSGTSIQVSVGYSTLQLFCPALPLVLSYQGPDPMLVDGDGNPRPPQVMVRWSDDRGFTWSNEHVLDLGALGDTKARAILRRLGRSRYRVYEISTSDPVPYTLVDGYLEVGQ